MSYDYEVVIVGGGSAGLAAALALGRARRSVLVIDSGTPRNAPATHCAQLPRSRGHPPSELMAIGREEVATYGGEMAAGTVSSVRPMNGDGACFRVELTDGKAVLARRLARHHGPDRRAARRTRGRRTVGPRRAALPVLPWLGGARPAHRSARQWTAERPPGSAVPAVEQRRHPVAAHGASAA
jgi:choline dehydrogenase-like flavoprotein